MKVRTLLCALVLGLCVQLIPGAFGQTEPNPPSSASETTQQPASQQPQASTPAAQSQPEPAPPAPQQKQPKVKPGSKDDVNSVGDRKMGGKGLGNWYSIEKEVAM
ncbi:MAG TPA: hypothetical protein VET69_00875, partial [Terriglobales bacterium]|nr:hypothetical protein [Terriglobales bacterium]